MVRSALKSKRRIGEGPVRGAAYVPAASVALASLLASLPILSQNGWYPDFGFLTLIGWRLLRGDAFPPWWAAPLGFWNDLVTGSPLGLSVALWTTVMVVLDLADRRTLFRDHWLEWGIAVMLLCINEWLQLLVAAWMGARLPYSTMVPPLLISAASFPLFAWAIGRIDHFRLGRP
jgi:rod shape-determining protein MreD